MSKCLSVRLWWLNPAIHLSNQYNRVFYGYSAMIQEVCVSMVTPLTRHLYPRAATYISGLSINLMLFVVSEVCLSNRIIFSCPFPGLKSVKLEVLMKSLTILKISLNNS